MFSSALLLFSLASICQYVMPKEFWQNVKTEKLIGPVVKFEEEISNVLLQNATSGGFFCGGTLISSAYILTAAECVVSRRREDIIVVGGRKNLHQLYYTIPVPIREIIIHEKYDPRDPWRNDIALLRLYNCILNHNFYIRYTPLLDRDSLDEIAQFPGQAIPASVSGYGIISENQSPTFHQLQKCDTYTYFWKNCKTLLEQINYTLSESHICAHDTYMSSYINVRISDVGGPLFFRYMIVGIALSANWGKHFNTEYPWLFTNVSSHTEWIESQIGNRFSSDTLGFAYKC